MKRHLERQKHRCLTSQLTNQVTVKESFRKIDNPVTAAEIYFATFVAEHNLPFMCADHFTKLCKVMFPDSQIAQSFAAGRTKTTAIMKFAIAPRLNVVVKACKRSPFSILCDGGNDQLDKKYFAILVRYWEDITNQVVTRFLALPVCNISTSQALFDALALEIDSRNIPWENAVGFASDTANVMVGQRNSVLSRVKLKQPNVFSLGCLCYLAALCAVSGLKKLPVSIDNLLIDIFYHFKHSSKRWSEFAEIQKDSSQSIEALFYSMA